MRGDGYVYKRGDRWWIGYYAPKNGRSVFRREPARIVERQGQEPRPARTETEAKRALKHRRDEVGAHRIGARAFAGPEQQRITVGELLDGLLVHLDNQGKSYAAKLRYHLKPVKTFFGETRACALTTEQLEKYQRERRAAGKAPATINRELEGLRRAFTYPASQTPPRIPRSMVPSIPMLPVDNVRTGYFDRASLEALLAHVADTDVADFIRWGFVTGMRKGEASRITWDMLDRGVPTWTLRIPASVTKNRKTRSLPLPGTLRTLIERRLQARRLDTPLIFHRTCKGKPGRPVYDITDLWVAALKAARLPKGMLFHDLRRSAVRTLVKAGVDRGQAMKISGHATEAMFKRYADIFSDDDTAEAMLKAEAYLDAQPIERTQNAHAGASAKGGR